MTSWKDDGRRQIRGKTKDSTHTKQEKRGETESPREHRRSESETSGSVCSVQN